MAAAVVETAAAAETVVTAAETVGSGCSCYLPQQKAGVIVAATMLPSFCRRHHHFCHFCLDAMVK